MTAKKYPIGIQTFSEIIRNGYVYVDKTDLAYAIPYQAEGRRVVEVGVRFDVETRTPVDWAVATV